MRSLGKTIIIWPAFLSGEEMRSQIGTERSDENLERAKPRSKVSEDPRPASSMTFGIYSPEPWNNRFLKSVALFRAPLSNSYTLLPENTFPLHSAGIGIFTLPHLSQPQQGAEVWPQGYSCFHNLILHHPVVTVIYLVCSQLLGSWHLTYVFHTVPMLFLPWSLPQTYRVFFSWSLP